MPPKAYFIRFDKGDPYANLAFETCLFEYVGSAFSRGENVLILALWQNSNTIVIGKNQDAAAECDLCEMAKRDIKLARRLTGGGAVYHDGGNLNFSFILPSSLYDSALTTDIVVNALKALGVPAEKSGRNDILADGKKISGNAYTLNSNVGLHHGTVLISSIPSTVLSCLTPDKYKNLRGKIGSVGSPVTNLKAFIPDITIDAAEAALKKSFIDGFKILNLKNAESLPLDQNRLSDITNLYSSKAWLFPDTKGSDCITGYYPWGKVSFNFVIQDGIVKNLTVRTDSLAVELWARVENAFCGVPFKKQELLAVFENLSQPSVSEEEKNILSDAMLLISSADL